MSPHGITSCALKQLNLSISPDSSVVDERELESIVECFNEALERKPGYSPTYVAAILATHLIQKRVFEFANERTARQAVILYMKSAGYELKNPPEDDSRYIFEKGWLAIFPHHLSDSSTANVMFTSAHHQVSVNMEPLHSLAFVYSKVFAKSSERYLRVRDLTGVNKPTLCLRPSVPDIMRELAMFEIGEMYLFEGKIVSNMPTQLPSDPASSIANELAFCEIGD